MPEAHEQVDAVVIGSGFGGSAAAWRLVEEGLSVVVLERGKLYPPGSFPRTPGDMGRNFWDPSEGLYGLFDIWSFRTLEGVVSSGVGGGSLIYANVLLRKDETWFVQNGADGEDWPVTRKDLEPHYDRVEDGLSPQRYPFDVPPYDRTGKTLAMREAGRRGGLAWQLPKLAVTFANRDELPVPGRLIAEEFENLHGRERYTCRLCGECDIGCNEGSKNSLDYSLLGRAVHQGAQLRSLSEVRQIAPLPGGLYRVDYVRHDPARGKETDTGALDLKSIQAPIVVVAAGTFGSTYLLLRNRALLPNLSPALGTRFSSNGDVLAFVRGCRPQQSAAGTSVAASPNFGPVITSTLHVPDVLDGAKTHGAYIQDGGFPYFASWLIEGTQLPGLIVRAARFVWRYLGNVLHLNQDSHLSAEISGLIGSAALTSSALTLLGMGRDVAGGKMSLPGKWLEVDWPLGPSQPFFVQMRKHMQGIAAALGGVLVDNPLWHIGRSITVHPLGGCPMGRSAATGVVDSYGEVFGHPGLIVADGSVMPGPVGANPSLTIAALSDRFAQHAAENLKRGRIPAGGGTHGP